MASSLKFRNDHEEEEVRDVDANLAAGERLNRDKTLASDLIVTNFSGSYNTPQLFSVISQTFVGLSPELLSHNFTKAPTIFVRDQKEVQVKVSDYGQEGTFESANLVRMQIALGMNVNYSKLTVFYDNNMRAGVAHVVTHHTMAADSDESATKAYRTASTADAMVRELQAATANNQRAGFRSALYRDNTDPVGFAFLVYSRAALHNSAIREVGDGSLRVLSFEEPTVINTLLSWPVSCEHDAAHDLVHGVASDDALFNGLSGTVIVQQALGLMAETRSRIVKVRLTGGANASVTYTTPAADTAITSDNQLMRSDDERGAASAVYYLRRKPDGRIWLTTPATSLFSQPRVSAVEANVDPAPGTISYFLTHLQNMQAEAKFILGRGRMHSDLLPGVVGVVDKLSTLSYNDNQAITLHFKVLDETKTWAIYPRTVAMTALSLLRGYGIRQPAFNCALVKFSELMSAPIIMGSPNGPVAAPSLEVRIPTIMTYGVQGMRATNIFGMTDPRSSGTASYFTCAHLALGMVIGLASNAWMGQLQQGSGEVLVDDLEDMVDVGSRQDAPTMIDLAGLSLPRDNYSASSGSHWRPGRAAASTLYKIAGERLKELAEIVARYGCNSPKWAAGMRTAIGSDCTASTVATGERTVAIHAKAMTFDYDNGVANKLWHVLPQEIDVGQRITEGVGDMMRMEPIVVTRAVVTHADTFTRSLTPVSRSTYARRRVKYPLQTGTPEAMLLAALTHSQKESYELASAMKAGTNSSLDFRVAAVLLVQSGMTDGHVMQTHRLTSDYGPGEYHFTGVIPACVCPALGSVIASHKVLPTDGTPARSSLATSAEALRKAAELGQVVITAHTAMWLGRHDAHTPDMLSTATISGTSSSAVMLSASNAAYLSRYTPTQDSVLFPPMIAYASRVPAVPATYHRLEQEGEKETGDMIDHDLSEQPDNATALRLSGSTVASKRTTINAARRSRRVTTASNGNLDPSSRTVGGQPTTVPSAEQQQPEVRETVRIERQRVYVTAAQQVLSEVISAGFPSRAAIDLLVMICDAALQDGVLANAVARNAIQPVNVENPTEPASFTMITRAAQRLGVSETEALRDPTSLAIYALRARKGVPEHVKAAMWAGTSGEGIKQLITAARKATTEGSVITDPAALTAPWFAWASSPDRVLQELAMQAIGPFIEVTGSMATIKAFTYGEAPAGSDPRVARLLAELDGKLPPDEAVTHVPMELTTSIDYEQALLLPALSMGGVLLVVAQVTEGIERETTALPARVQEYLTAFAMGSNLTMEDPPNPVDQYRASINNAELQASVDPRCAAWSTDGQMHYAMRHVSINHLVYANKMWAPNHAVKGLEEEVKKKYDTTYVAMLREIVGRGTAQYRVGDDIATRLTTTKTHN